MIYLRLCVSCLKKGQVPQKGLVVRPMVFSEMNSRGQVDLIDMQSQADVDYKRILVYQDHLTKFVNIRPTKTKRAAEIAYILLDIFCTFDAPSVLQSDNGREFADSIINELSSMWDGLKIVHGKPRHSQSQGSVERANRDIEDMLLSWLAENSTTKWADGRRFVQTRKNNALHGGLKCSPYEAMFGQRMKIGLKTSNTPVDVMRALYSEEDLAEVINSTQSERQDMEVVEGREEERNERQAVVTDVQEEREEMQAEVIGDAVDGRQAGVRMIQTEEVTGEEEQVEIRVREDGNVQSEGEDSDAQTEVERRHSELVTQGAALDTVQDNDNVQPPLSPSLCERRYTIAEKRRMTKENLELQAKKMTKSSCDKFPPANVEDTIKLRVPENRYGIWCHQYHIYS